jgi:hypothetical protein
LPSYNLHGNGYLHYISISGVPVIRMNNGHGRKTFRTFHYNSVQSILCNVHNTDPGINHCYCCPTETRTFSRCQVKRIPSDFLTYLTDTGRFPSPGIKCYDSKQRSGLTLITANGVLRPQLRNSAGMGIYTSRSSSSARSFPFIKEVGLVFNEAVVRCIFLYKTARRWVC